VHEINLFHGVNISATFCVREISRSCKFLLEFVKSDHNQRFGKTTADVLRAQRLKFLAIDANLLGV
jgi:hypothetical protein